MFDVVNVVDVDDEKRVGNSLLQVWTLKLKVNFLFRVLFLQLVIYWRVKNANSKSVEVVADVDAEKRLTTVWCRFVN